MWQVWSGMFQMNRQRALALLITAVLAGAVGAYYLRRRPPSERDLILRAFEDARVAAAERRVGRMLSILSDNYHDNEGNTKDSLRAYATAYLFPNRKVSVRLNIYELEISGRQALASVRVRSLDRESGGRLDMDLKLDLVKEDKAWKVVRASGVKLSEP